MIPIWTTRDPGAAGKLAELRRRLSLTEGALADDAADAAASVRAIIDDVARRGDQAVLDYTERFDRLRIPPERLRVSQAEVRAAYDAVPPELLSAIRTAAANIETFQRSILAPDPAPVETEGVRLQLVYRPVASAGVYVPGGSAPLCSSVLMSAVPARVAGVPRVVVITPPGPGGAVSPDRLVAAAEAGVTEIYRVGGAQAIAALACGTESIPKVDFVVGPGNLYVTLAKREVYGRVGIDLLGGPSEVVILADADTPPDWVALDMISQAEHAPGSAVLLTDSPELADAVKAALARLCPTLARGKMAAKYLAELSAVIVCEDMNECVELANEIAPEHLEILTRDADALAAQVTNAGACFVGARTPVAVGDYWAGPSHVLPTGGTARFSSGLNANIFRRAQSLIRFQAAGLARAAADLAALTTAEGLVAHGASVAARLEDPRSAP